MPPTFGSGEQPHETVAGEGGGERDPADGSEHAKSHGSSYRKSRAEQSPRERVAHDEGGERAWDHAGHESECPAVAFVCVVIVPGRAPEQESTDQRDHRTACELELRRTAALSEGAADHGEAGNHQDKRKSDMG